MSGKLILYFISCIFLFVMIASCSSSEINEYRESISDQNSEDDTLIIKRVEIETH